MNVLMVLGGGIGNIIQATPAIKTIASEGHRVDLCLHCNSSQDIKDIFNIEAVTSIYVNKSPSLIYDWQLNGPFTPGKQYQAKNKYRTKVHYAQHIPEANVYYDLAQHIGIKTKMLNAEVCIEKSRLVPKHLDTVAIYPGSKFNWAMKRWDKYDELANKFEHVAIVGTKQDIHSHGNPTWIKKPWSWDKKVEFVSGSLKEMAYFLSKCKMFIGNDGGLSHIAAATGIPTFVLFGPSSYIKNKPFAKNAHVIAIDLPCRPCQFRADEKGQQIFDGNKFGCPQNMKCMKEMSSNYVYQKISESIGTICQS